jgi:hypothetical protein
LDGTEVSKTNFPLPTLESKLQDLSLELHQTRGFFMIRGLNSDDYSPEDNIIIFLGISSYVGEKRGKQDEAGNMLSLSSNHGQAGFGSLTLCSAHQGG